MDSIGDFAFFALRIAVLAASAHVFWRAFNLQRSDATRLALVGSLLQIAGGVVSELGSTLFSPTSFDSAQTYSMLLALLGLLGGFGHLLVVVALYRLLRTQDSRAAVARTRATHRIGR